MESKNLLEYKSINKTRSKKKNLIFSIILVLIIFLFLEIILHVFSLASPYIGFLLSPNVIVDEKIGVRPNPMHPEHDQKGWRNKSVPSEVSIVCMGDSQTYGHGVTLTQSWPQQLEKLSEEKTYNMAYGGYGPAHRLLLLEEAISMKPKLIIEAFYSGNDLYDSYSLVYDRKQLPDLKTADRLLLRSISEAENIEPLRKKIKRISSVKKNIFVKFRVFLSRHSKIYGVLRAAKRVSNQRNNTNASKVLYWESVKQTAKKNKEIHQVFIHGNIKTVFTSYYRYSAIDLDDPRIQEGYRISLESIRLMKEHSCTANIKFVALLIPSKELVFKDIVYENLDEIPQIYKYLIEKEELFWEKTKDFFQNQGIHFIESLSILRKYIKKGNQPYKISADGHPNFLGHQAIAEIVLKEIKKQDLLNGNNKLFP